MSGAAYDPRSFRIVNEYDIAYQEFVCRMVCVACDPHEPEAVRTWVGAYDLRTLNMVALSHWDRWHAPE